MIYDYIERHVHYIESCISYILFIYIERETETERDWDSLKELASCNDGGWKV